MRKTEEMVCLVVGRRQIDGEKEKPKSQTACTRITKLLTEKKEKYITADQKPTTESRTTVSSTFVLIWCTCPAITGYGNERQREDNVNETRTR